MSWIEKNSGGLIRRFSLTSQYQELKDLQNNSCSICGKVVTKLCLDHDHETGQVRGFLCVGCNWGLGHLEKFLNSALKYLENSKTSQIFLSDFPPKSKKELVEIARQTFTRLDVKVKRQKIRNSPESKQKISQQMKESWANQEEREKRCESLKKGWTPEARKRLSDAKKKSWREKRDREFDSNKPNVLDVTGDS